jgi:hypothetical protein
MNAFPAVDPIPLPAPVWLFKVLHMVTLALHFISVEMLLGGLLVATWLSFFGANRLGNPAAALRLNASAAMARRLPVVMTYVINLGVPPLLFAQVLYGRALYTSSVLIGIYWIAVVFLLMACYWLLYQFGAGTEAGKRVWWKGLLAWLIAGSIAKIYSTNMTLMLRPEVWQQMYSTSASGTHLPPPDPTLMARWLFMMTGGLWVAGLWMIWLASRRCFDATVRSYLAASGGRLALVMVAVQAFVGFKVWQAQPDAVQTMIATGKLAGGLTAGREMLALISSMGGLYRFAGVLWLAGAALVFLFAVWAAFSKPQSKAAGYTSLALVLVTVLAMTLFRDGIRDLTLLSKGFDVWHRTVVTNWSVVGLFLALFVAGLVGLGWLISVVRRARPVSEKVV